MTEGRSGRLGIVAVAVGAVLVVALGTAGALWAFAPSGITVTGTLELSHAENVDGHCDTGLPGFTDIHSGAQIVVTDSGGKTVAIGRLGTGTAMRKSLCLFEFTIENVPADEDFYAIEVARRGKVQFPRAALDRHIRLSVG